MIRKLRVIDIISQYTHKMKNRAKLNRVDIGTVRFIFVLYNITKTGDKRDGHNRQ